MPTDARIFTGRMNDDDHPQVVPSNDYRYAQNVRISVGQDGGTASIKNVPGTSEVAFTLAGTSGLQVVGSIADEENNRVFYFVKADSGFDEILCYFADEGVIRRVAWDGMFTQVDGYLPTLGLSADNLVTGVAYVYPWLFWTDNNQMPRRINTERGLKTFTTTYFSPDGSEPTDYSLPLNYKDVSIIREPPRYPIETRKLLSTDEADVPDQTTNQIILYAFQFTYRFFYKDGSQSVLAPYSKLVPFNTDSNAYAFDTIEIKIPKRQLIPNEVDEIQILVRDPQTNSWGIITRFFRETQEAEIIAHNTAGAGALTYYFYNTVESTLIPEAEAIKPFDSVPLKSKAMEVSRNRLFLANNLDGYDPAELILLSADRAFTDESLPPGSAEYIYVFPDTNDPDHFAVIVVLVQTGDPAVDGYYEYQEVNDYADFDNGNLPDTLYLSPNDKIGDLGDFDPFNTGLIDDYALSWGSFPVGINSFVDDEYSGTQPKIFGLGSFGGLEDGDLILKSGSRYQIGLVFYDYAGRNNGVYTNEDCIIEIPERSYTFTEFTTGITWLIDGLVNNNDIPFWATHYSIVRTKNLTTSFFVQGFMSAQFYVEIDNDGNYNYVSSYPTNNEVFALAWNIHTLYSRGLGYTYSDGDVLKFWEDDESDPKQYAIIGQDGKYVWTRPEDLGTFVGLGVLGRGEIYTPIRTSDQPLFYEVGEIYAIENAGTIDKAFSVYSGQLRGDVYYRLMPTVNSNITNKTEAMSPNGDVWKIWHTDAGRPNAVILDAKQERRKTAIRWSNQYVASTKINGLCSFNEVDELIVEEAIGPIQKLVLAGKSQAEGSVMLSIGTNNTFSLYLGETQVVDNAEQTLLATSGNVIGTQRDLRGGFGTNNAESVVENDGRVYWFDQQRGSVIRYAANGLTPISDYKFRSYFNRISKQVRGDRVIGGFDRLGTEYLLTFIDINTDLDIEYLNDYTGSIIGSGDLAVAGGPVSLAIDQLQAGLTYTFTVNWDGPGLFYVYLSGVLFQEYEVVAFEDLEIEITPNRNVTLGYFFVPSGPPPRGRYTVTGPLISPHQAWQGNDLTIAFRDIDGYEGWSTVYSFIPEWFTSINNVLISFVDGKLYTHDNEESYNTFYGTQYKSGIAFVVNAPQALVKWPAAIGFLSNDAPSWVHVRTEIPYIQSSDLEDEEFVLREGYHYASILMDRLSPNETGTYFERSLKGDRMRSAWIEFYAEFSTFASELNINIIKVLWQPSTGHF